MSEVAGRMATQIGAQYLQQTNGGKGILFERRTGRFTRSRNCYRWRAEQEQMLLVLQLEWVRK